MRKGQRVSSSSESEDSERSGESVDCKDESSPSGCSSDEDSSSDSDVEAGSVMKRSQRFSNSFSFGEAHQTPSRNRDGLSPKSSNGVPIAEHEEAAPAAECIRMEKRETLGTSQPPRSGLFRPQDLWLAMTKCLSLRWPPCLSINRQSTRKLAYQVDLDQSEDSQSSVSSDSTNESSSSALTSDDRDVMLVKLDEEEVKSKRVKSGPLPRRGISRSSPRVLRARQATDSFLASMILEKETFLRIELVDSGDERGDLRYRAEWKLSEKTKELAEGVWLSRNKQSTD
ncbi:uncharacterized protein V6R79_023712 [Siganus canaliculatus]